MGAAIAAVRALAAPYGAAVVLLSALEAPPPTSRMLPETSALMRDYDRDDLRRRLDELAQRLRSDVADVRTIVEDRRPTDAIVAAADALAADLIVLVTDAHGRLSRWYDPSTAQHLLTRPELTLLLIREL